MLTNNAAVVTWNSIASQTYQLQYENSVTAGSWTNVGANVPATGTTSSATDAAIAPEPAILSDHAGALANRIRE